MVAEDAAATTAAAPTELVMRFRVTTFVPGTDGRATVDLHAVDPYVDDDPASPREHPNKAVWLESPSGAIVFHVTAPGVSDLFALGREFEVRLSAVDAAVG
jgi:hypothetical protein